ncbi:hypothetical protein SETIT_8G103000v2 [Setaria italica]|uniref:Cleavage and polyadenylation specificity factor subunit 2 n=2 Tax=Setaria italica TaxID=4555 RepID=A0A368S6G3_SETIT|nr:hypothetical protein SETIT_8G103000v2 [Setaria italica]
MGASVQVTPLSGAYGEGPLCYLLAVDGFRFLLDCGWTDLCDTSQLEPLAKYGPYKGEGIVIVPHVAGHHLRGTVWKITKDGEDVVYAVDFNHQKERHLNGTALGSFARPAVLITDAYNALNNQCYKKTQDEDFYWVEKDLVYPIYFLTNVSTSTIDYVRSLFEWMGGEVAKSFEDSVEAFLLRKVTVIINKEELDNLGDNPKVVLASMASLEVGFSHDIFVDMANEEKNCALY